MLALETSLKIGHLTSKATTQRNNYDFNSFFNFNGKQYGVAEDKLVSLGGDSYDGVAIDSYMVVSSSFGYVGPKAMRSLYAGLETSGDLLIELSADESTIQTINITKLKTGQQFIKEFVNRSTRGCFWKIKISNVNGADYSIDYIQGLISFLQKNRSQY